MLIYGLMAAGAFARGQAPSALPEAPSTTGAPDSPGIYTVGNGVTAPRVVFAPEPEFSEEARKQKISGDVLVSLVIGADGKPRDIKVAKSIGEVLAPKSQKAARSLDEKALAAVRQYRFEPAMFEGHPVPVRLTISINFQIF